MPVLSVRWAPQTRRLLSQVGRTSERHLETVSEDLESPLRVQVCRTQPQEKSRCARRIVDTDGDDGHRVVVFLDPDLHSKRQNPRVH